MRDSDTTIVREVFNLQKAKLLDELQKARSPGIAAMPFVEMAIAALENLDFLSDNASIGADVISFLLGSRFVPAQRLSVEAVADAGVEAGIDVTEAFQLARIIVEISNKRLTENYYRLVLKFLSQGKVGADQVSALTGFFQGVIRKKVEFLTTLPELFFELFYLADKTSDFFNEIKIALEKLLSDRSLGFQATDFVKRCRSAVVLKLGPEAGLAIDRLLVGIANEWITTKASVMRIKIVPSMLAELMKESNTSEMALLKPEAKQILIDFNGVIPTAGPLLREKKLLFVRHGIGVGIINLFEISSLIEERLGGDTPDLVLLEEVLDSDSYLMKFIRSSIDFFAINNLPGFITFVLAISEATLSLGTKIDSFRLLNFLKIYIPSFHFLNIGQVFVQLSTSPDRLRFFQILEIIASKSPELVLIYLYLRSLDEQSYSYHLGLLALYNNLTGYHDSGICADEKAVEKYINLLEFISDRLGNEAVAELVRRESGSFGVSLSQIFPKRVDLIFRLILNHFLSPEALERLKEIKHAVAGELIKHSRTLEKADAIALLSAALTRESYLGSYFYLQRASKPCALGQHGALDTIFAELQKCDSAAAAGFAPAAIVVSSRALSLFGSRPPTGSGDEVAILATAPDEGPKLALLPRLAPGSRSGIN